MAGAACDSQQMAQPDMMSPASPCGSVPTTGQCTDATTVSACVTGLSGGAKVITTKCGANYGCVTQSGSAFCKLQTECRNGQSRCTSSTVLQQCQGGRWVNFSCTGNTGCTPFPGLGSACVPKTVASTVNGQLLYEERSPNPQLTGYTAPSAVPAKNMLAVVVDGDGSPLGSKFIDSQGNFSVPTYKVPGANAQMLYLPVAVYPDNTPAVAVAPLLGPMSLSSNAIWTFNTPNVPSTAGNIALGTQTIKADSSGAIQIFEQAIGELARMQGLFGNLPTQSLAILWNVNVEAFCLACYLNRSAGGTDIGSSAQPLHFDTTIMLSGTANNPLQWSNSVVNHEINHFVMDTYSKPPGEGGAHYVEQASSPGLAYSEAYATFAGQASMSVGLAMPNPIYFTSQQGTSFWIDLSKASYSLGMLAMPNPMGPIDQKINENVLASIMWDLWRTVGDAKFYGSLKSKRVTGGANRGYTTVDFIDLADAQVCSSAITAAQMGTSTSKYQYPWDNKPLCVQ